MPTPIISMSNLAGLFQKEHLETNIRKVCI
jgi:hypothetical protein